MKILCLTTFLDGKDRFQLGDQRTVSDEDGARFISNGWAREVQELTLGIDDVVHKTTVETQHG